MEIDVMIAEYEKRLKTTREQLGSLVRIEQQLIGALTALQQLADKQPADKPMDPDVRG